MDLSAMSLGELKNLEARIAKELPIVEKRAREQALEQIYSIANSVGLPLKTLMAGGKSRKPSRPGVQYQDPANPNNKWLGKGARPAWFKNYLAAGKSLEELRAA